MRSLSSAVLILAIAPLCACHGNDLGTGANTVDREYSKPASAVCKAALQSVESAEFSVLSERHDGLGGLLVASRADGGEVRILVQSLDETSSRVSVRVEPGNRDLANLMQERIAGNLGMGVATTGLWFGGNSLDATYRADMASCTTSARRTIVGLTNSKREEIHVTWAEIDGRLRDSTPVRIRMERWDGVTRVWFIVGTTKNDNNQALAQKMKDEFEATTGPAGGSK